MKFKQQGIKLKVVLDTNVIISAAISKEGAPARIFELLLLELIENFTSKEIIDEIKEDTDDNKFLEVATASNADFIISGICILNNLNFIEI